jgi:hypothetical protein
MNPHMKLTCTISIALLASLSAQAQPPAQSDEPVVGQMEHSGYGLVGSGGRHYIFGGLAVADYAHSGQHHVVTLQLEEPSLMPKADESFLYYRELGSGRRWAIGRHPLADDSYAVYIQPASAAGTVSKWSLFHRARLIWPEGQGAATDDRPLKVQPQIPQMTKEKGECIRSPLIPSAKSA